MSLAKCPNCGKDLPNESNFCPYCMENLSDFEAATVPETTSAIKCPNCGKDLPSESSFCPYCMERLSAPVTVTVPSKKKKLSKKTVTIIIVAVVLVALLAGGIALFNHYKNVKELEERKVAVNAFVDDLINSYKATRKETERLYGEVECRTSFDEDYYDCIIYVRDYNGYDFMEIECMFVKNTNDTYEIYSVDSTLDYTSYFKASDEYENLYNATTEVVLPTFCLLKMRNPTAYSEISPTLFCSLLITATIDDENKSVYYKDDYDYITENIYGCDRVWTSFDFDEGIYECHCIGRGESKEDNSKNNTDDTEDTEKSGVSENNVTENNSNSNSNLNNNSNNSTNSNSNQGSSYDTDKILNAFGGTGGNSNSSTNSNSNQGGNSNAGNGSNENDVTVNTNPCDDGHKYIEATCTAPQKCSVCGKISGKALGHDIYVAKCKRCGYSDFSKIAKSYANDDVYACDGKTGEAYDVTNVKISSSGVLSFTFNGKNYAVKLVQTNKQIGTSNLVVFDCYVNGVKEPDATCMYNPDYGFPQFEWKNLDGHNLYFCAEEN